MISESISTVTGVQSLQYLYPLIVLGIAGFIILGLGLATSSKKAYAGIAFGALAIAAILILLIPQNASFVLSNSFAYSQFGAYFAILFVISSLFIVLPSLKNISAKGDIFYALLLFVTTGMIVAAFTMNLIVLFISFEAVSIGTYVLAAFHKTRRTLEASTKYFFTGVVSTSFIIFGLAFFYQAAGTFELTSALAVVSKPALLIALLFLTIGFGFKVAIFPMHQWAIDTYYGAENSVSAFLSTGSKLVAFMIMLKIFIVGFSTMGEDVFLLFTLLAIFTMTYGNISALSTTNVKKLFAYSSIAQAGYLILVFSITSYALWSGQNYGLIAVNAVAAAMLYSLVYIFMKGGAFVFLNTLDKENPEFSDISGFARKSPALALSLSIILLALAGIPFTGGFTAKFYMFLYLVDAKLWWLAIIAILNSAISVFYYFRVIMYMYWKPDSGVSLSGSRIASATVIVSAIVVVALFFYFPLFSLLHGFAQGLFGVTG